MLHQMPAPLKPRAFTILTISGVPGSSPSGSAEPNSQRPFLTLTLPLNISNPEPSSKITTAKYSMSSSVVHGAYVSIEHVYLSEKGDIVWDMVTASNAKGNLPMGVQKLGISGAIVKDVGLFLGWVDRRRKGNQG